MNTRVQITREWCMPSSKTFSMRPVRNLIDKYIHAVNRDGEGVILDPFANESKIATITNDIDPDCDTTYHLEATDFLRIFAPGSADMVLYDPPYSSRQLSECYKRFGKSVTITDTQTAYWSKQKTLIGQIVRGGGYVLSFGWNSGGIGKKNGFEIVEILLVAHGGMHNDTICVVERKTREQEEWR